MKWWVSFWAVSTDLPHFEYHGPWWVSGERGGWDDDQTPTEKSVCMAVVAETEVAAKRVVEKAFDKGHAPTEFRFVNSRPDDWVPFGDRFERKSWMKWPWPMPTGSTSNE